MNYVAKTRIVEYVPYAHRNECCAVALLVFFDDGRVEAHPASSLRKAKILDPSCNVDTLREGLVAVAKELQESPEAASLYTAGATSLRISERDGFFSYSSKDELDKAIEWQLAVAINPVKPVSRKERASVSRLYLELKYSFDQFGWMAHGSKGIADHLIVPRFPVLPEEGLSVDFAMKNGAMHYIQAIDYRHNPQNKRLEANAKLLTLGLTKSLTADATNNYAVFAGTDAAEAKAGIKLAERTANDIFISDSEEDMGRLMDIVAKALGQEMMPTLSVETERLNHIPG